MPDRPGHDIRYSVDSTKLMELHWEPSRLFEEALDATVRWYVENESWWRCLKAVASAEGSPLARLKLLPLVFVGAELSWLARRKGWPHVHVHSCGNAATAGACRWEARSGRGLQPQAAVTR